MVVALAVAGLEETHAATSADMRPHLTVLDGGRSNCYSVEREVHPNTGTILAQTRQHYDKKKIDQLALSLREQGLMHAGEVAALDEVEAREYLRAWNRIWGKRYKIEGLDRWEDDSYLIVIAGHCRKKAAMQEVAQGHGVPAKYRVVFQYGITAQEAIDRQFQENIHSVPEPWEDAEAAYRYWKFLDDQWKKDCRAAKRAGQPLPPKLTVKEFSKKIGRSETAVRGYLRFAQAPAAIQRAVRKRKISYGKGMILAQAAEGGFLEGEGLVDHWLTMAQSVPTVKRFRKAVEDRKAHANRGQGELVDALDLDAIQDARAAERRAVVLPEMLQRLFENTRYFSTVLDLFRDGKLGDESLFSTASPARAFLREVEILEQLLPYLREEVEVKRFAGDIEATLSEAGELLAELADEPPPGKPQEVGLFG